MRKHQLLFQQLSTITLCFNESELKYKWILTSSNLYTLIRKVEKSVCVGARITLPYVHGVQQSWLTVFKGGG